MTQRPAETNGDGARSAGPRGIVTLASSVDVDQLLRRVVVQIEKLGLELFAVIDHSGDAEDAGLAMPDTKLVIFGNPKVGTPLILAHPLIALDLPLKLLLWETSDEEVFVGYNAPSYLAERHGLSAPEADSIRVVEAIARAVVSS
jgi:uncharacterized protein (DUF302 family)